MGELCPDPTPSARTRPTVVAASGDRQADRPSAVARTRPNRTSTGEGPER
ncbi:hypothetical protein [Haloarcula onubensis]|uniref:Uncharacterized protein n=1 Tax=Haloarcula onubensis TaxID=2950539 RepID=A0ABU2FLH2_9EURY|nr:hypothetical protein [Halomicroarcula sp. S3CR25-11]MDS0281588.1 hypothetical protein [Halomicroarcula sp. S3CR25-11]